MIRRQAFKFELMPTGKQQCALRCFAGARRFVFNKALALQNERHAAGGKYIGYVAMEKLLTAWRHSEETPWLKEAPVHPLQHALRDLECAFQNFFAKRAGHPRFCKRGQHDRFRYPDSKQIKLDQGNARIFLPKLGWLRYRKSRTVLGAVKQVTVCSHGEKWFASIQTEREVQDPLPAATTAVGIDLGIVNFAALSDGSFVAPLNSFREFRRQLRYKAAWRGATLVAVPPHNTSRTCPGCGHVSAGNRCSQARFVCLACHYENHADVVGALNILARGTRVIACGAGAQSGSAMKQEPAGALVVRNLATSADGIPFLSA